MDAAFRAAEAHGIRAILGKVMMDRVTYDPTIEPSTILDAVAAREPRASRSAGTGPPTAGSATRSRRGSPSRAPRSCSRESATLARELGCWWQTHVSEDAGEIAEVARLFPEARDYVDVYDRAGGLGPASDPRPRDPPLPARGGAAGRDGHADRPLPDVEPVHRAPA